VPVPSDLNIPQTETCEVCKEPLGTEPYWIVGYPKAVHERCRDWSTVPFPYSQDLASLRRLVGRAQRVARTVIAVGTRLAAIEREWPRGGTAALAESRHLLKRAREELASIGLELARSAARDGKR
jgi:hypothetical protein